MKKFRTVIGTFVMGSFLVLVSGSFSNPGGLLGKDGRPLRTQRRRQHAPIEAPPTSDSKAESGYFEVVVPDSLLADIGIFGTKAPQDASSQRLVAKRAQRTKKRQAMTDTDVSELNAAEQDKHVGIEMDHEKEHEKDLTAETDQTLKENVTNVVESKDADVQEQSIKAAPAAPSSDNIPITTAVKAPVLKKTPPQAYVANGSKPRQTTSSTVAPAKTYSQSNQGPMIADKSTLTVGPAPKKTKPTSGLASTKAADPNPSNSSAPETVMPRIDEKSKLKQPINKNKIKKTNAPSPTVQISSSSSDSLDSSMQADIQQALDSLANSPAECTSLQQAMQDLADGQSFDYMGKPYRRFDADHAFPADSAFWDVKYIQERVLLPPVWDALKARRSDHGDCLEDDVVEQEVQLFLLDAEQHIRQGNVSMALGRLPWVQVYVLERLSRQHYLSPMATPLAASHAAIALDCNLRLVVGLLALRHALVGLQLDGFAQDKSLLDLLQPAVKDPQALVNALVALPEYQRLGSKAKQHVVAVATGLLLVIEHMAAPNLASFFVGSLFVPQHYVRVNYNPQRHSRLLSKIIVASVHGALETLMTRALTAADVFHEAPVHLEVPLNNGRGETERVTSVSMAPFSDGLHNAFPWQHPGGPDAQALHTRIRMNPLGLPLTPPVVSVLLSDYWFDKVPDVVQALRVNDHSLRREHIALVNFAWESFRATVFFLTRTLFGHVHPGSESNSITDPIGLSPASTPQSPFFIGDVRQRRLARSLLETYQDHLLKRFLDALVLSTPLVPEHLHKPPPKSADKSPSTSKRNGDLEDDSEDDSAEEQLRPMRLRHSHPKAIASSSPPKAQHAKQCKQGRLGTELEQRRHYWLEQCGLGELFASLVSLKGIYFSVSRSTSDEPWQSSTLPQPVFAMFKLLQRQMFPRSRHPFIKALLEQDFRRANYAVQFVDKFVSYLGSECRSHVIPLLRLLTASHSTTSFKFRINSTEQDLRIRLVRAVSATVNVLEQTRALCKRGLPDMQLLYSHLCTAIYVGSTSPAALTAPSQTPPNRFQSASDLLIEPLPSANTYYSQSGALFTRQSLPERPSSSSYSSPLLERVPLFRPPPVQPSPSYRRYRNNVEKTQEIVKQASPMEQLEKEASQSTRLPRIPLFVPDRENHPLTMIDYSRRPTPLLPNDSPIDQLSPSNSSMYATSQLSLSDPYQTECSEEDDEPEYSEEGEDEANMIIDDIVFNPATNAYYHVWRSPADDSVQYYPAAVDANGYLLAPESPAPHDQH